MVPVSLAYFDRTSGMVLILSYRALLALTLLAFFRHGVRDGVDVHDDGSPGVSGVFRQDP